MAEPQEAKPFSCECDENFREVCAGRPFYKEHEGRRYCVLHYPGPEKAADFAEALTAKLDTESFDFRGVWFPDQLDLRGFEFKTEANFRDATFAGNADFVGARFSEAANFGQATFIRGGDFGGATFSGDANFGQATFSGEVDFHRAAFSGIALFGGATFSGGAHFREATFSGHAFFRWATFKWSAAFDGSAFSDNAIFIEATFGDTAHFIGATFEGIAGFYGATFSGHADLHRATFNWDADFDRSTFSGDAHFRYATFGRDGNFGQATFSGDAAFEHATFSGDADFVQATFSQGGGFDNATSSGHMDFSGATFSHALTFRRATLSDQLTFAGSGDEPGPSFLTGAVLDLQYIRIEKPEKVLFHSITLSPAWFINVDARRFDFRNVTWRRERIAQKISGLSDREIASPHRLLSIAYRQLAVNAEENHRYEEASEFRYRSMELRRRERLHGLAFWRLSWWYWLASGYGERIAQAAAVLILLLAFFAFCYTRVGFDGGAQLGWRGAVAYTIQVATFQKPEPKPATEAGKELMTAEIILVPIQAALLLLAIRRKFTR